MSKRKRKAPDLRTVITPHIDTATVQLSNDAGDTRTFRKKILHYQDIVYPKTRLHPGGRVRIDRAYGQSVIDSFKAGALDQPTLQLATATNGHNMLPERMKGAVVRLSHQEPGDTDGPGLYADVRATSGKAAKMLRRNPLVGVSAQIKEGLTRVDGRSFARALQHVLVTTDPRVTGLGPWRTLSLSHDDAGSVLDLHDARYEEHRMSKKSGKGKAKAAEPTVGDVLELSNEEIEDALAEAASALEAGEIADDDAAVAGGTLALASEVAEVSEELRLNRIDLAESRWATRRAKLAGEGVPKSILDLAGPLMAAPGEFVLELANRDGEDEEIDAREIVSGMLDACCGIIELAAPGGRSDEPEPTEDDQVKSGLAAWDKTSGPAR